MRLRPVLIGFAILVALVFIAATIGERYAEKNYAGKLIPINDDFGIVIGDVDIQVMHGRLRLKEISLPDTISWASGAQVGSIDISGIHWMKLITRREVKIKNVSVRDAKAIIDLSLLQADSAIQTEGSRKLSVELTQLDLLFDENMHPSIEGIKARNISYKPEDGFYDFELKGVSSHDTREVIILDSLIMKPRYPKFEFGYRKGRRGGSIDLVVPEIHLHEFDLQRLTKDSIIDIRSIDIIAGNVQIFTDKRLPVDQERYAAMPHEALLNSSQYILIDSINVRDLYLRYESINPNTLNEGYIEFKNSYLGLTNVTNVPERIDENHVMRLDLFSKFMGVADLNAHFSFLLNSEGYEFSWTGTLEQMKIEEIDKFTIPVANMNIVEGDCESIEFQVVADIDSSHGAIDFSYENLKVMAIDPETHRNRKFISKVANLFFVKQNNVKGSGDYRVGKIDYAHETNRGLEHYVWTSLERGLMHTILPEGTADRMEKSSGVPASESSEKGKKHKKKKRKH